MLAEFKNISIVKRISYISLAGISFISGIVITKNVVTVMGDKSEISEDYFLIKTKANDIQKIKKDIYLSELAGKFSNLLNVDSFDDVY